MAEAWPIFEVSVEGFGSSVLAARTRGAALYSRFLDFTDCCDITFREWLKIARARRLKVRPPDDPYSYVRRNYAVDVQHGTRVALTGEGADLEGKRGTVVHPDRPSTAYVHVVLDGTTYVANVHPFSIIILDSAEAQGATPCPASVSAGTGEAAGRSASPCLLGGEA